MRAIPRDGEARDDTITPVKRISDFFLGLEFWTILQSCVWSDDRHPRGDFGAGQVVQRHDPPGSMAGRFGGIRVRNWQAHSDLIILTGFPQECGPSGHKGHFWNHVTKTIAQLRRRTSFTFGGDFNGDPIPDDAAIGWHHPCETLTDNGAHISEICAAQLWNPTTWSARPMPPNPSWEGNTWRGHNGAQSRPDRILLLVDLASPSVTFDFRSSQIL